MVEAYSTNLTVSNGNNITFNNVDSYCGCNASTSTSSIKLNRKGLYEVTLTASGYNVAPSSDPIGLLSVQMYNNGIAVPQAIASATSTTASTVESISFTTLVPIKSSCCIVDNSSAITFKYLGDTGTFTVVDVVVKKIK